MTPPEPPPAPSSKFKHAPADREAALRAAADLIQKRPGIVWVARGIVLITVSLIGLGIYGLVSHFSTNSDPLPVTSTALIDKPSLSNEIPK